MTLTQDKLDKIWEVATTIGKVEGWSAHDQGNVHLLVPDIREEHYHYQRPASGGEWERIPGMWPRLCPAPAEASGAPQT